MKPMIIQKTLIVGRVNTSEWFLINCNKETTKVVEIGCTVYREEADRQRN